MTERSTEWRFIENSWVHAKIGGAVFELERGWFGLTPAGEPCGPFSDAEDGMRMLENVWLEWTPIAHDCWRHPSFGQIKRVADAWTLRLPNGGTLRAIGSSSEAMQKLVDIGKSHRFARSVGLVYELSGLVALAIAPPLAGFGLLTTCELALAVGLFVWATYLTPHLKMAAGRVAGVISLFVGLGVQAIAAAAHAVSPALVFPRAAEEVLCYGVAALVSGRVLAWILRERPAN